MAQDDRDIRNFLFFLSDVHPPNLEDALIGALAVPSSWEAVAGMIRAARAQDPFARSIMKVLLYIHVPFCERLCAFCHCPRVLLQERSHIDIYIKNLLRQMMFFAPVYAGMDADSVCFGGGTPSLLDAKQIGAILDGVDRAFPARTRRILFEAHPASWTASKLKVLSARGLYRLSVGVQSFDANVLKKALRHQARQKVLWCLRSALKARVPIVNVDLIAGLPGQTLNGLVHDVHLVIDEGIDHVHLQPYTSFSLERLSDTGESALDFLKRRDALMRAAAEVLTGAGFRCKGLGEYVRREARSEKEDDVYPFSKAVVAAFGPFAEGEFPGVVSYSSGGMSPSCDFKTIKAAAQDPGYAMSQYAMLAAVNGLDEHVFLKRFGVSLQAHCGDGLQYLERCGLLSRVQGQWRFAGKWEFRRVHAYAALSRVLFGKKLLLRLRQHYGTRYDPRRDYEDGKVLLKAYSQNWLTTLYYQGRL